jgi:hypothetical protein
MDSYQEREKRVEETRVLIEKNAIRMFYECEIDEAHKKDFTIGATTDLAARILLELPEDRQDFYIKLFKKEWQ